MMQADIKDIKLGIVGLGLIGGSLGIDFRQRGWQVLGVSRSPLTCDLALERGAVDQASDQLSLLKEAEVIFICTPLGYIAPTVKELLPYLTPETVLTDVGSVKEQVLREVLPLWPSFVGGHPMAGTAAQGIRAAQEGLFTNAPYVLTATDTTPTKALETVASLVRSLGVRLYFASPADHDQAVSLISHLPVMISASLISTCGGESNNSIISLAQNLASSGFRDTSRVGGGNPELGLMMAQYNRKALLTSLTQYQQSLQQVITLIETENWQDLESLLAATQESRKSFL
jgi:arogenate dehydrogenase (NADP+)